MNPHFHDGHFLQLYAYHPGLALNGFPFHFKDSPGQRMPSMPILYASYREQMNCFTRHWTVLIFKVPGPKCCKKGFCYWNALLGTFLVLNALLWSCKKTHAPLCYCEARVLKCDEILASFNPFVKWLWGFCTSSPHLIRYLCLIAYQKCSLPHSSLKTRRDKLQFTLFWLGVRMPPTFPKGGLPKQWPRSAVICQVVRGRFFCGNSNSGFLSMCKHRYLVWNTGRRYTLQLLKTAGL